MGLKGVSMFQLLQVVGGFVMLWAGTDLFDDKADYKKMGVRFAVGLGLLMIGSALKYFGVEDPF